MLRIPGGLLAAALFALHPVNVESVAWITQLKNTLSLVLTLLSVLLYLLHEQRGGRWLFAASVAAFALATLAKGMTLMLPVVLLALRLVATGPNGPPRFAASCSVPADRPGDGRYGAVSATFGGGRHGCAQRRLFEPHGRCWLCGVVYLWKLVWPVNLMFVYPKWHLDTVNWRWFLPGLLLAALLALGWWWRGSWGRPVVIVLVCYVALLLPVLGFANIYFMEYSLVADHWQYAAMIVPCAAFAGAVAGAWGRWRWIGLPGMGSAWCCWRSLPD